MQVVVIGAGLLGLSTAYALQQDGHDVCVVDASDGPARETSFANAGMLSPSLTDPWNSPGVFLNMLRWLGREEAPFLLRPRAIPSLLDWGTRFFWQSRRKAFLENWAASLELGLYSMRVQEEWVKAGDFRFQAGRAGILKIFRDEAELEEGLMRLDFLARNHVEVRRLDMDEALEIEPSLEAAAPQLTGAILHTIDGHGDAHLFCRELERSLRASGTTFHYKTRALGFERERDRIRAVNTDAGGIEGVVDPVPLLESQDGEALYHPALRLRQLEQLANAGYVLLRLSGRRLGKLPEDIMEVAQILLIVGVIQGVGRPVAKRHLRRRSHLLMEDLQRFPPQALILRRVEELIREAGS